MRDNLKDIQYWSQRINQTQNFQKLDISNLKNGKIKSERINIVKRALAFSYIECISAKYSIGHQILDCKTDLLKAIDLTHESWVDEIGVKFNYKGKHLNQFLEYDQILWMLSLGYLLDIDDTDFKKLVEVIDRNEVKDYLFEFIIRAKVKDRQPISEESYEFGWILFEKLRQAIIENDKSKAEKLVKEFITKDWYKEHKDAGWYNSHKSKHDTYFGYWSFETAAVVKIMGLDDSGFVNCQYYPKDLVNHL